MGPQTEQELFDRVAIHLLSQKARSLPLGVGGCRYRGAGNRKCAMGIFIPDDQYSLTMEGSSVASELVWPVLGMPEALLRLAVRLQGVHDACDVPRWPEVLRRIGDAYGLSTAIVTEMT